MGEVRKRSALAGVLSTILLVACTDPTVPPAPEADAKLPRIPPPRGPNTTMYSTCQIGALGCGYVWFTRPTGSGIYWQVLTQVIYNPGYTGLLGASIDAETFIHRGSDTEPDEEDDLECTSAPGTHCETVAQFLDTCPIERNKLTVVGFWQLINPVTELWASKWDTFDEECLPPPRKPKPKFVASTATQTSGDGGTLTVTAGYPITLTATTSDYGYPAAAASDHEWYVDQTPLGSGASTSHTPGMGTHSLWVSLGNSAGFEDVSMNVVVSAPDEAGSCDDPLTDVVEGNCNGQGNPTSVGVCSSSSSGTRYCYELDWYVWNEGLGRYVFGYTEEVYCWYAT
jgi:hypothetical protein